MTMNSKTYVGSDVTIKGPATQTAVNTDLITGVVSGWYDARDYHSGTIQINCPAGTYTTGAITFEQTNDTTLTGQIMPVFVAATVNAAPLAAAITLATTTTIIYEFPITARYIRARISTAISGASASAQAVCCFSQQPFSSTRLAGPTNASQNVAQFGGSNVATGTGAGGAGIPRVTLSNDSTLAANQSCNIAQINGVAVTTGNGVAGTGVQRVVLASDNTANSNPFLFTPVPSAAQGASTTYHAISAASTNATSVKASAGTINDGCVSNINAAARYFKLYNKASAPTVGTDTPILTLLLPPNSNTPIPTGGLGLRCSTGVAYAITTGIAVADTGAVAASEHSVHLNYT